MSFRRLKQIRSFTQAKDRGSILRIFICFLKETMKSMLLSCWKYFGAFLNWSWLIAVCFWTVSLAVHISLSFDSDRSWVHSIVWALRVHIHQHSAERFFFLMVFALWKSFPRRLETNSSLGFSVPICNLKYAYFKTGPLKHLASFFLLWGPSYHDVINCCCCCCC